MRIIYMGTPEFAAIALSAIVKEHEVVAVVTQPDKPQGRNRKLVPTPVKVKAQEYDIPVYQPEKVRETEMVETLRSYKPDVIVVAAYGQILPESILSIPPYGCINIHASLLPKYRGAAPIERAIIDGETVTGVTTMYMEKGLDTGDMIDKVEVAITPEDTGATLHFKKGRRCFIRESGAEQRISCNIIAVDIMKCAAEIHSIYLCFLQKMRLFQQALDCLRTKVRGIQPAQRTSVSSKCRAHSIYNYNSAFHGIFPFIYLS